MTWSSLMLAPTCLHGWPKSNLTVVFNALHGRWGEDGCVQGLLEWLGIPYTHSGVLASALAMDKAAAKAAYAAAGLPMVTSVLATRDEVSRRHVMPPPYVVKPNNEGSSVGVYIVREGSNAPRLAETMPETVMVETYAPGREMTVAVMGDRALAVTDIITDGWYDFDAKYKPGGSRHVVPGQPARRNHRRLPGLCPARPPRPGLPGPQPHRFPLGRGARAWQGLILLETNTQPGMTPTSLAPEQAAHCGISFPELCDWIVKDASCNR